MSLTEACIRKPVFAWMLMAATVVFGLVAASRIGISQFPDVDFPTISVSVDWEGAAPAVIENDVVETGQSTVGIRFADGTIFSMSAGTRMVINHFVYDPDSSSNSALASPTSAIS